MECSERKQKTRASCLWNHRLWEKLACQVDLGWGQTSSLCRAQISHNAYRASPMRMYFQTLYAHLNLTYPTLRRKLDILNEAIPSAPPPPAPETSRERSPSPSGRPYTSIRTPSLRRGSGDSAQDMEELIKRTLEDDEATGSVVERLADSLARSRHPAGRPRPLRRFDTA